MMKLLKSRRYLLSYLRNLCFICSTGKLKLEKPKAMEKKSALTAKLYSASLNKDVLPPITTNTKRKTSDNTDANGNSMAYQVTFDENDKIKTKKNSKFSAPLNMIAPTRNQDDRYNL